MGRCLYYVLTFEQTVDRFEEESRCRSINDIRLEIMHVGLVKDHFLTFGCGGAGS